jgi:hypothetical protein
MHFLREKKMPACTEQHGRANDCRFTGEQITEIGQVLLSGYKNHHKGVDICIIFQYN